ncbi:transposase [Kitasatospora sp. NPDC017646]|uniref:transposase n=1 Tax=Kitasatospora sp. NPDC017646 TaxID=3364024 RepID=UPI0037BCA8E6
MWAGRTRFVARRVAVGAGHFTVPTFRTFAALVTGLIAQTGRCTVTGMLAGAGLTRTWSHDRAHTFFSRARWNPDILGVSLSHLIVRRLLPEGTVLTVAVDDTLFKRRGKKVFGAAWQHDGAAKGPKPVGRGTCFVVVGLVVELPFLARPVCLPVMARLWRPRQESKVDLAASMLRLLAACHHGRRIHVVADAAYHGKALRDLPATCTSPPACPRPRCSTASPHRAPANAAAPRSRAPAWARRGTWPSLATSPPSRSPDTSAPTRFSWPRPPAFGTAPSTPVPSA